MSACGIGDPWGPGPWRVIDGRLTDVRKLPHLGNAGRGVSRKLPHLGNAGRGVNRELPHLGNAGQGPPDALAAYMRALSARLARVRITAGDWRRVLKPSVTRATAGNGNVGILLDPPYSVGSDLYATTSGGSAATMSAEVRQWCIDNGGDFRIVMCGFDGEHDALLEHGWRKEAGRSGRGAGYNTDAKAGRRERLWLSPNCLSDDLFAHLEAPA